MAGKSAAVARPQDPAISDVSRGVGGGASIETSEDARREQGTDASQREGVDEHDPSPAATAGQQPGGRVIETYGGYPGGAVSSHGNLASPPEQLITGEAPDAPNTPQLGSPNAGHKFHPDIPNPKNQSPVIRGIERDPRNDPTHPGHPQADRTHPDYGKPASQHVGRQAPNPTYAGLRDTLTAKANEPAVEVQAE